MGNFMDTGNGYPSTATPFAMDLATPIMAITQQMVKRRKEEIATNKDIANNNEAMMLKALDFETVKGLSDGIQEEHVKAIDSLSEKWASRMAQVQGKLSSVDKLELVRDQKKMETDIADKKANVLAFVELQNFIRTQPEKARMAYDVDATLKNMSDWATSGKIGADGASFLGVPRVWTGAELFQSKYGVGLKNVLDNRDETVNVDGKIVTTTKFTPEQIINDQYKIIDADPTMTPIQKTDAKQYVVSQLPKNIVQSVKYPPQPRSGGKQVNPNDIIDANKIMQATLHGDSGSLDNFMYKVGGSSRSAPQWTKDETTGRMKGSVSIFMPDGTEKIVPVLNNQSTEEEVRAAKLVYNAILPPIYQIKGASNIVTEPALTDPIKYDPPTQNANIASLLSAGSRKKDIPSQDSKGNDITDPTKAGYEMKPGYKRAIDALSADLPANYEVRKTNTIWGDMGKGSNNIEIIDKTDPQNPRSTVYDWTKPEDVKALLQFHKENSISETRYRDAIKLKDGKAPGKKVIDPANINTIEEAVDYLKTLPKFQGKTDAELRAIAEAHKK